VSYTFVASGLIFVASSMFQAMGNTIPSLVASSARVILVAVPVIILSHRPDFKLIWIWWISAATVIVQLAIALLMLRREFGRRLNFPAFIAEGDVAPIEDRAPAAMAAAAD
jgi:Na+-driven multidrug efflux pump